MCLIVCVGILIINGITFAFNIYFIYLGLQNSIFMVAIYQLPFFQALWLCLQNREGSFISGLITVVEIMFLRSIVTILSLRACLNVLRNKNIWDLLLLHLLLLGFGSFAPQNYCKCSYKCFPNYNLHGCFSFRNWFDQSLILSWLCPNRRPYRKFIEVKQYIMIN